MRHIVNYDVTIHNITGTVKDLLKQMSDDAVYFAGTGFLQSIDPGEKLKVIVMALPQGRKLFEVSLDAEQVLFNSNVLETVRNALKEAAPDTTLKAGETVRFGFVAD